MQTEEIIKALEWQSQEEDVQILHACESGSRAWGFASTDSDYDVRFIYAHPREWYLSVFTKRDVIEQPIDDLLDMGGWDLRKALLLLYKSNSALIEWLHSPIIYMHVPEISRELRKLVAESFRPLSVCHHYLGMAQKGWQTIRDQEQIKLKRYFYTLRALLSCEWIIDRKTIPPVAFLTILDEYYAAGEFRDAIEQLLRMKANSGESDRVRREHDKTVFQMVDRRIDELFRLIPDNLPENTSRVEKSLFENSFIRILDGLDA